MIPFNPLFLGSSDAVGQAAVRYCQEYEANLWRYKK